MKRICAVAFAAVVIGLFAGVARSQDGAAPAAKPLAEWTFMFYMDADNDLESAQMNDLDEMMTAGSNAKVNIVALVDRNVSGDEDAGYTNRAVGGLPNWTTTKLVMVRKGKLELLGDPGEVNMGDPANLAAFVNTMAARFPAKRYALIFGNHGSGWPGILHDEGNKDDSLSMTELGMGLSLTSQSIPKIEMIGFDACLMANFEVARTVAPFGKVLVASEELEPGNGWDYEALFGKVMANPAVDGFGLGKVVVDTYGAYYGRDDQGNRDVSITLSMTDLSKIEALNTAINDLGVSNQAFIKAGGRANLLKVARARSKTEEFGSRGEGAAVAEFFDLVHYATNIKAMSADPAIGRAADAVIAATKAAVVYKVNGAAHARSGGLSIFFPAKSATMIEDGYVKHPFARGFKWPLLLADFTGIIIKDTVQPELAPVVTSDDQVTTNETVTITSSVKGDDIDEATFVLAEQNGEDVIIFGAVPSEPDDNGVLSEEWDGTWFAISDGRSELICPISDFQQLDEEGNQFYVEVPGQVRFKGRKEWNDITMYFVVDFKDDEASGQFVYAFQERNGQQREVEIDTGDSVRPVYINVDKDGETTEVAHTDVADILKITADNGLFIGMTEVAAGDYLVGFTVTDLAGNSTEDFVAVSRK